MSLDKARIQRSSLQRYNLYAATRKPRKRKICDWLAEIAYLQIKKEVSVPNEAAEEASLLALRLRFKEILAQDELRFEVRKVQLLNVAIRELEKNEKALLETDYPSSTKGDSDCSLDLEEDGDFSLYLEDGGYSWDLGNDGYSWDHEDDGYSLSTERETRWKAACAIVDALCYFHPKTVFEPCPNRSRRIFESYPNESSETVLLSAFQFAASLESKRLLEIILDAILDGLDGDSTTYPKIKAPKHQVREPDGNDKATFRVVAERKGAIVELLFRNLISLPQEFQDMVFGRIQRMMEKNKSSLNETIWQLAVIVPLPNMVRCLLEAKDSMFITETHAKFIIDNGTALMWNMFPESFRRAVLSAPDINLLRKIVFSGKVDMVEEIFRLGPALVDFIGEEEGCKFVLQHLEELNKDPTREINDGFYETLRSWLVNGMVRNRNLEIQDIRTTLKGSKVEAYEMSFHLPQFRSNNKNGSFADYVRGLKTMEAKFFRFEKVLKYATFPELSGQESFTSSEDMRQDHSEVMDVFDWLRDRGAQKVLRLSVGDRLHCPHTGEDVAACVNTFGVRDLNWRKLDLYLKNMTDSPIEELHLYSSGNRSVHDQWLSQLPRFKQLKKLFIYVVKDVIKPRLLKQITEDLENDLNELNRTRSYPWTSDEEDGSDNSERHPKIKVSQIWVREPENPAMVDQSLDNRTSDILSMHLAKFVKRFCDYNREHIEIKKTKVALIDSGVVVVGRHGENLNDDIFNTIARQIVGGTSLVSRDGEEYMWWHATEPHGTQMAALICTLNPLCDLYVVKVAESNASGITGNNVAKAIEWARDKGVDVISLSLVAFSDPENKMFEAIKAAREDDIVITCSIADEGNVSARSVSENNENVLSIAACDRWGNLLPQSRRTGFDYQFLGHNVHIGRVPYLESREIIEGSSVSTAIAAGMASLILACTRISSPFSDQDIYGRRRSWRCETVRKRFDSMSEGKWVILDNLCGQGELRNFYNFERLVKDSFTSMEHNDIF